MNDLCLESIKNKIKDKIEQLNTLKRTMKTGLYKYIYKDKIIYIGMSNAKVGGIEERVGSHSREDKFIPYLQDKDSLQIVYVTLPKHNNLVKAFETGLINQYKPVLNVAEVDDISAGQYDFESILQADWKDYNEYIKEINSIKQEIDKLKIEYQTLLSGIPKDERGKYQIHPYAKRPDPIKWREVIEKIGAEDFKDIKQKYLDGHPDYTEMLKSLKKLCVHNEKSIKSIKGILKKIYKGQYTIENGLHGYDYACFKITPDEGFAGFSTYKNDLDSMYGWISFGGYYSRPREYKIENPLYGQHFLYVKIEKIQNLDLLDLPEIFSGYRETKANYELALKILRQ